MSDIMEDEDYVKLATELVRADAARVRSVPIMDSEDLFRLAVDAAKREAASLRGEWRPIKTCRIKDYTNVDLWLTIPSAGDGLRITESYRKNGQWVHLNRGREETIFEQYITHWMPVPKAPKR